jgi:hypothetical protein
MSSIPLPLVSLQTGTVSWKAPTTNTDGSPIPPGELTGYIVGLRSLTAANTSIGVYPILSPKVDATVLQDAFTSIAANLKQDDYATAVKATSVNGDSAWSAEVLFTGVLPIPNPPQEVAVS